MSRSSGVWRWYTKARRVPTLIGKDSSGRRLPGGPYTALQIVAAPVIPIALWNTRGLWSGSLGILAVLIVIGAASVGGVKLLGKIDFASRNPLYLAASFGRQVLGPAAGSSGGRALRIQPVQRVLTRSVLAAHETPQLVASEPAAVPVVAIEPTYVSAQPVKTSRPARSAKPARAAVLTTIPASQSAAVQPAPTAASSTPRQSGLEAFLAAVRNAA